MLTSSLFLSAQTGSIKGRITTSDGKPAEYVSVMLEQNNKGAITDENGEYVIKNIAPGNYTLKTSYVGLKTQEENVTVAAGEILRQDFTLTENAQELKEVVIMGARSANMKTVTVGKAPIKPIDLPQSVATIDHEVLERQQTQHLSDAVKNINGIYVMSTSGGTEEELAGRGFAFSSSNTLKNGVRFNNGAMPEMSGLERIEVMKGSSAILYGSVSPGGVINLITKKPQFEKGGEISMRVGSFDFYKPSLDIYGAFNNSTKAAYRINTTYETANSYRDEVGSERFYINPSFLLKLSRKTELLVEGDYLKDNRTRDYGTGAINYEVADVPRNRFLGASWSYYNTLQKSATATLTHHFSDSWEIRSSTSYQHYDEDMFATTRPNASSNFVREDGTWIRGVQRSMVDEAYYITQLDLTGRFKTFGLKHNLLVGADADKYLTNNTRYNNLDEYDSINIFDLSMYKQRSDIPELSLNTLTKNPVARAGAYVQDLLSITDKIKLLAGARYSYIDSRSEVLSYKTNKTTESKSTAGAVTPRFGLVIQPIRTMALFASYANSFDLNSGVDINGNALPPSYINQYEAGIKNDLFKGLLSANLTAYRIVNSNLAQMSLANGNTSSSVKELTGEVTSKGVELDIMTKSIHGFSAIAGYSFNETKYTRSNTYIVGSLLRYNPAHTANASLYYSFGRNSALKGLNLGVSSLYIGQRMAGRSTRLNVEDDKFRLIPLSAYTLFDVSAGYALKNFSLRVKLANIFDTLNYNAHDDNSINPIAPRNFVATLSYKL